MNVKELNTKPSALFKDHIGEFVVFGAKDGKANFEGRILAVGSPGWALIWWPNSGGRQGWRNISNEIVQETGSWPSH